MAGVHGETTLFRLVEDIHNRLTQDFSTRQLFEKLKPRQGIAPASCHSTKHALQREACIILIVTVTLSHVTASF